MIRVRAAAASSEGATERSDQQAAVPYRHAGACTGRRRTLSSQGLVCTIYTRIIRIVFERR